MRASTLAAAVVLALASPAAVQAQEATPAVAPAPAADPADVASPEAIIDADQSGCLNGHAAGQMASPSLDPRRTSSTATVSRPEA